jgi:uncharacterized membrane protein YoaK (UPF0700 family)
MAFATALTALAGFTDAVGYAALSHLYLSFMSGNSTHFGMSIAGADGPGVFLAGAIIFAFVVGAALGTALWDRFPQTQPPLILGVELTILIWAVTASSFGYQAAALIPVAGAMGMQNVLHQVISGADVGKGFITGSLFALGQSFARLARNQGYAAVQNAWSWLAFIAGVSSGSLAYSVLGLPCALGAVTAALATLLILTSWPTLQIWWRNVPLGHQRGDKCGNAVEGVSDGRRTAARDQYGSEPASGDR